MADDEDYSTPTGFAVPRREGLSAEGDIVQHYARAFGGAACALLETARRLDAMAPADRARELETADRYIVEFGLAITGRIHHLDRPAKRDRQHLIKRIAKWVNSMIGSCF